MTIELEEATRQQVAKFLPKAIKSAFDSYYEYAALDWKNADDTKSASKLFAEHHGACKTALSHIELLLKLGRVADIETRVDHTHLALLRHTAEAEVNAYHGDKVPGEEQDGV